MHLPDYVLLVGFAIWTAISLIAQFKTEVMTKLRYRDILHLIPNWHFFAPVPSRKDYHLEYRVRTDSCQPANWTRVKLGGNRRWFSAIWYPEKRIRKTFNTHLRRITKAAVTYGSEKAGKTISYLALLNYLQHLELPNGSQIQFRIVSTQDYYKSSPMYLVFLSDWHVQIEKENHGA